MTYKTRVLLAMVALSLGAILLGSAIAVAPSSAASTVLFGITPLSTDRLNSLNDVEGDIGRELDLVRVFEAWNDSWGGPFIGEIEDSDRVMLLSISSTKKDGSRVLWRDIADAQPGSSLYDQMVEWVDRVEAFDGEVWFTFNHEPESSSNYAAGNNQDFIAAWRKFIGLFQERNLPNVKFNWIMTYWAFATRPTEDNYAPKWYPGDEYVDFISSDAYNWDNCKSNDTDPWQPLADVIEAHRQFGLDHPDKGLVLAEWASTEIAGDGGAKAAWIEDAQALFKKPGWEQFVALSWFHVEDTGKPSCEWLIDTTSASLAAFIEMAADPFYGGPTGGGTTTLPPTSTTTTAPPADSGDDGFFDVDPSNIFYEDIVWLAGEGITKGCNPPANNLFCPNELLTRGQMAAFLVRAFGYTNSGGGDLFIDDNATTFENDIDRLAAAGVTQGCNPPLNNLYCPSKVVTRGQMAAFLVRALGLTDDGGGNLFIDDDGSTFEVDIAKACGCWNHDRLQPACQ